MVRLLWMLSVTTRYYLRSFTPTNWLVGAICVPAAVSVRQIGSTPNSCLYWSMYSTINAVDGRAPPRKKPTPTSGSADSSGERKELCELL